MKVVTICLWNRPDCTQRMLKALSECDGIKDYKLLISIDGMPVHPVVSKAQKITSMKKEVWVSQKNIGCNNNTKRALAWGFSESDYVIHLEDDIVVAKDTLKYFEWAKQFRDDSRIYLIGSWRDNRGWLPESGKPFPLKDNIAGKAVLCHAFHCWGWATWADRWKIMEEHWTAKGDKELSWDVAISNYMKKHKLCEVIPLVSRAVNIGANGTHRGEHPLSYWAGSPGFKFPSSYELVGEPHRKDPKKVPADL